MHRGHLPAHDAEGVIQKARQRGQRIGRARGIGNDPFISQITLIGAHDNGDISLRRRARDKNPRGPRQKSAFRHGPRAAHAGAFQHEVNTVQIEFRKVRFGMEWNGQPINDQLFGPGVHLARPRTENAVVLKEISTGCQRFDVIDEHNLEGAALLHQHPQQRAPDAAKPVDGDADWMVWHGEPSILGQKTCLFSWLCVRIHPCNII